MDFVEERREGLRWLAQLRWWALGGTLAGVVVALGLNWTFVDTKALSGGVVVMGLVNLGLVWRVRREADVGKNELSLHATADLLFLTWLLAWSGGVTNPISFAFSFHVVLGALLNGRRGAVASTLASLACIAFLSVIDETHLLPVPALEHPPRTLWVLSLGLLVAGLGYLALVVAERQAAQNRRLVEERKEATSSVALLLESLEALQVGLDLVGADGASQLKNETARALEGTPQAAEAARSVEKIEGDQAVLRRFAVGGQIGEGAHPPGQGNERIIDLIALPPSQARPARALLYVDRTDELLVEQRHVMLERLATLGRAMQGVAHELNTPLTTMQTLGKDLRAALADAPLDERLRVDVEESLSLLIDESKRCRALTQALLSRADDGRAGARGAAPSLLDVARRAVRLVAPTEEGDDVDIDEVTLALPCPVDGDRVLQVVMNLVQNALRATVEQRGDGRGPRVTVRAERAERAVVVRIVDRGPGLPDEVRARLFEPFVTTRPVGEGTGLGLYTSQRIAHEIGGSLAIEDAAGGGTVAVLTLPAGGKAIDREPPPPAPRLAGPGGPARRAS